MNVELLKYIAMLQLAVPNTGCLSTSFSFDHKRNYSTSLLANKCNIIINPLNNIKGGSNQAYLLRIKEQISNNLFSNAVLKFLADIKSLNHFVDGYQSEAVKMFSKSLIHIAVLTPSNLIVGLTATQSIYFRFYTNLGYETHLEVFFNKEDEVQDNIDAVVSLYQNDVIKLKKFGSLNSIMSSITHVIKPENANPGVLYFSTNLSSTSTLEFA